MNAVQPLPTTEPGPSWGERNQHWLVAQLQHLRAGIEAKLSDGDGDDNHGAQTRAAGTGSDAPAPPADSGSNSDSDSDSDDGFVPALTRCAELFGLSPFERDVLLLLAGLELDAVLRQLLGKARARRGEPVTMRPNFSLALALLDAPHWDALSPQAPLRYWRLLTMDAGDTLTDTPLRVDERLLHFLTGVAAVDEHLHGRVRLLRPGAMRAGVSAPEHDPLPQRIARFLQPIDQRSPLAVLTGNSGDNEAVQAAALAAATGAGRPTLWLRAEDLPTDPQDLADIGRLLDREAALSGAWPVLQLATACEEHRDHARRAARLLEQMHGAVLLLGELPPEHIAELSRHRMARFRIQRDSVATAIEVAIATLPHPVSDTGWQQALSASLRRALQQFRIGPHALDTILQQLAAEIAPPPASDVDARHLDQRAWTLCREAARGGLDSLAQRVDARTGFDDIVLPAAQTQLLRGIGAQLRHRHTVYEDWGFAAQSSRGLGLCALFAGESGTGKTMAAEAIANEAGLDLYRIDLASVVSKYIGETEKNLKRLFDAAEASGAVLLFDEADALFGKRSEVKDSHDRYANVEIAYLLQRIEAYRGLAILTTNLKSALDRAFLRRIRFIVQFPFPDLAARTEIWRRVFPPQTPVTELDPQRLARLQLAGGHIRNIAINAAFAVCGQDVHDWPAAIRAAARTECAKLERNPSESELRDLA